MSTPRVLIVEDEAISARAIALMVKASGGEVIGIVDNGEEAVENSRSWLPDVVLMDVRLKGEMTGIEAASAIRRRYPVKVILLTAYSVRELFEQYELSEPLPYLIKPVGPAELAAALDKAMRTKIPA